MKTVYLHISLLFLGACSERPKTDILMNQEFMIPANEIPSLRDQALLGSMPATAKLFQYYSMGKYDLSQAIYWAEIGDETCNCKAAMEYLARLRGSEHNSITSLIRARFWAEQAKNNGSRRVDDLISQTTKELKQHSTGRSHVPANEQKALAGSIPASLNLASKASKSHNHEKELYWTHIAVQNGYYGAIHKLGLLMQIDPDRENQLRARYWLDLWTRGYASISKSSCGRVEIYETDQEREKLTLNIAHQLNVTAVDILHLFHDDNWTLVYVDSHAADKVFLFFPGDPLTARFGALWNGANNTSDEAFIRKWELSNAPGMTTNLADCFSWYVTTRNELDN